MSTRPRGQSHYKYQLGLNRVLQCAKCQQPFEVLPSGITTRKFCSETCYKSGNRYDTKIEQQVEKMLKVAGIPFEKQYKITNQENSRRYTFCDFFVKPNLVIFVDGDYWHDLPITKARDGDTNKFLAKQHFLVFRIKESQLKADSTEVNHRLISCFNKNIESQRQPC